MEVNVHEAAYQIRIVSISLIAYNDNYTRTQQSHWGLFLELENGHSIKLDMSIFSRFPTGLLDIEYKE